MPDIKVNSYRGNCGTSKDIPQDDPLHQQIQIACHRLQHRIALAPMTRMRASDSGVINACAAEYYSLRATPGGLLVSEGIVPNKRGQGFPKCPGIWSQEQVVAWKPITSAVKAKGAVFFAQLWHVGRVGVPSQNGGLPMLCATKVPLPGSHTLFGTGATEPYVEGEAMSIAQIYEVTGQFVHAAQNCMAAGFDGIEIHGGNGYLFDTFIHSNINDRTDEYGGSLPNRLRFTLQVIDAISAAIGPSRTAIRLAPFYTLKQADDANRLETFSTYSAELDKRGLAYVHMMEPRYDLLDASNPFRAQGSNAPNVIAEKPKADEPSLWPFRCILKNTVFVTAGSYTPEIARKALKEGCTDIVAFGRHFTSNPDLVRRILEDKPLTPYDRSTFYTSGVEGYLGWETSVD